MDIINNGSGFKENGGYNRIDNWDDEVTQKLSDHYEAIIKLLGEDSDREGLHRTPLRVAKAMQFLTQGYNQNPVDILKSARFKEDYQHLIGMKIH